MFRRGRDNGPVVTKEYRDMYPERARLAMQSDVKEMARRATFPNW